MHKKSKPSIDPEIERVLQLILDENVRPISSDHDGGSTRNDRN